MCFFGHLSAFVENPEQPDYIAAFLDLVPMAKERAPGGFFVDKELGRGRSFVLIIAVGQSHVLRPRGLNLRGRARSAAVRPRKRERELFQRVVRFLPLRASAARRRAVGLDLLVRCFLGAFAGLGLMGFRIGDLDEGGCTGPCEEKNKAVRRHL